MLDFRYGLINANLTYGSFDAASYIDFKNNSDVLVHCELGSDYRFGSLNELVYYITDMQDSALGAGQVRWQYLRNLGYDVSEIPSNLIIPSVPIVNIANNLTSALTPEQWLVLCEAYLNNLDNFFNSTNYREYTMTSTNVRMPNLDYSFNAVVYNANGALLYNVNLTYFIPYSHTLTLIKVQNVPLNQPVDALTFNGVNNMTLNLYSLNTGNKIFIHDIYKDNSVYNGSSVALAISTLYQTAQKYDFTIIGELCNATTTSNWNLGLLTTLMVPLILLAVVVPMFTSKRRR